MSLLLCKQQVRKMGQVGDKHVGMDSVPPHFTFILLHFIGRY
jgi:hypothetical protein